MRCVMGFRFRSTDRLGSGGFSCVYKGRHDDGRVAGIKEIPLRDRQYMVKAFQREISILKMLSHNNLLLYYDHLFDPISYNLYIATEFCNAGDLSQYIKKTHPIPEPIIVQFTRHIALGLQELSRHQVVHRDLKPQNLLLHDDGTQLVLKIADFGFARVLDKIGDTMTTCGTPLYEAPEILQGSHRYTAAVDLWSAGVIIFEIVTGSVPFPGRNHRDLIHLIDTTQPVFPAFNPSCSELLQGLLQKDPLQRLSLDRFLANTWAFPPALPSIPVELSPAAPLEPPATISNFPENVTLPPCCTVPEKDKVLSVEPIGFDNQNAKQVPGTPPQDIPTQKSPCPIPPDFFQLLKLDTPKDTVNFNEVHVFAPVQPQLFCAQALCHAAYRNYRAGIFPYSLIFYSVAISILMKCCNIISAHNENEEQKELDIQQIGTLVSKCKLQARALVQCIPSEYHTVFLPIEKILYDHAVSRAYSGCNYELLGLHKKSITRYRDSLSIMELLYSESAVENCDRILLDIYIKQLKLRLDFLSNKKE
ncbi:serine/threonine-protein kinase ATG1b [Pelomyxa schiedti]|nr:serine/threonine-protein kinase ATG1b [Pelomyxa schiedti]